MSTTSGNEFFLPFPCEYMFHLLFFFKNQNVIHKLVIASLINRFFFFFTIPFLSPSFISF
ncbi:hypothetical protein CW304_03585 [Bacillus sp. UFRGS-B20]|nr:hypothetical protein CW304_03585 [Bacillus sp. UFRGS-B20]